MNDDILGVVRRIFPFSSVDGPGNRTAVFLQGCNMACLYCHNPETIKVISSREFGVGVEHSFNAGSDSNFPVSTVEDVQLMSVEAVVSEVLKVRAFTAGVTFSGGECTLQHSFIIKVVKALKVADPSIHVLIDTNGLMSDSVFQGLAECVDGFMFDLKSMNAEEHEMLTGVPNAQILKNLETAMKLGKLEEIRTVVVPVLLNNYRNVYLAARKVSAYDGDIRYKIIKFRNKGVVGALANVPSPTDDQMLELKRVAVAQGCRNIVLI